jgi:hypothetical protein
MVLPILSGDRSLAANPMPGTCPLTEELTIKIETLIIILTDYGND